MPEALSQPCIVYGSPDATPVRTRLTFFFLYFLVVLSFLALGACSQEDDAEAIRTLIQRGAALAEQHDIGGILDLTSQEFRAQPGDLDRNGVKGVLWRAFRYYGDLRVLHPRPGVALSEDGRSASAGCPFLIVKKDVSLPGLQELYDDPHAWVKAAGEKADLYRMTLGLRKKGDEWLVEEARLERFTGVGFES